MPTRLFYLLSSLLFLASCAEQKPMVPLPEDGTAVFYDQNKKPFYHSVASGDPLDNKVIIWTRVTP